MTMALKLIQTTIQTKDEVIKTKDEFIKDLSDQKDSLVQEVVSLYRENKLLEEMRRTLEIESTPLLQLQGLYVRRIMFRQNGVEGIAAPSHLTCVHCPLEV